MRLRSVEAVVRFRGDDRQHLALPSGERRATVHDLPIHPHRRVHGTGIQAHDVDDVPDPPRAFDGRVEQLLEAAGRFGERDLVDVRHGLPEQADEHKMDTSDV